MSIAPASLVAVPEQSNMSPSVNKDAASFLVLLIIMAVLSFNYYHVYTFWSNRVYDPAADNYIMSTIAGVVWGLIAFLEIPLTVLFYNSVRLVDGIISRTFYFFLLATVVIATTMMGSSSQNGLDEKRTNSFSSYDQQLQSLNTQEQAALSKRDATIALAKSKQSDKKDMLTASANAAYYRNLARIGDQKARLMGNKPLNQAHGTGIFSMDDATFNLFWAGFLSLMGVALTIYKIDYVQAMMRIPVVSLKNKLDHDWTTSKDDFQNQKHSVSPVKNILSMGYLASASSAGNITPLSHDPDNKTQPETNTSPVDKSEQYFTAHGFLHSSVFDGKYNTIRLYSFVKGKKKSVWAGRFAPEITPKIDLENWLKESPTTPEANEYRELTNMQEMDDSTAPAPVAAPPTGRCRRAILTPTQKTRMAMQYG